MIGPGDEDDDDDEALDDDEEQPARRAPIAIDPWASPVVRAPVVERGDDE